MSREFILFMLGLVSIACITPFLIFLLVIIEDHTSYNSRKITNKFRF